MNDQRLEVAPDVVERVVRVLTESVEALSVAEPTEPAGLGHAVDARHLAHHTALARRHVSERLDAARTGLLRCADGIAGLEAGVRKVDDQLAVRLRALARGLA